MTIQEFSVSHHFIWRRAHSLMGLWLVLYLFEHLLVNSQAALWIGDDGIGFVRMVDLIQSLPYLQIIETIFIGIPLLVHGGWGIKRALSAKKNRLPYERNRAFNWQRLTSWILLVGLIGHVLQMRFLDAPKKIDLGSCEIHLVKLQFDEGLYTLAPRLGVKLYNRENIESKQALAKSVLLETTFSLQEEKRVAKIEKENEARRFSEALRSFSLKENQVIAVSEKPGTAILLMVRETFKNPWMVGLYTLFVLAAAFHAFNGFWTALLTWGVLLSWRAQRWMLPICWCGVLLLSFFGLAAIWGSYWINLRA